MGSLRKKLKRDQAFDGHSNENERILQQFENSIETGFQLATSRGPLCAEPVEGLVYFAEILEFDAEAAESEQCRCCLVWNIDHTYGLQAQNRMPQVIGSLITSVQEACRNGLLDWSPRLMLAMYSCDIQASSASDCSLHMSAPSFSYMGKILSISGCSRKGIWRGGATTRTNCLRGDEGGNVIFHCEGAVTGLWKALALQMVSA